MIKQIGQPKIRKEGLSKVTGRSKYIDDVVIPDMLYGVTVRSTIARGKIKSIKFLDGVNWSEFVVATAKDIPGKNVVTLIEYDQPLLADVDINHFEEPILLLAHENKHMVEKARDLVKIEYEVLPSLHSIQESLDKKIIVWGANNIFKEYKIEKGNPDSVWSKCTYIVEGEYATGAQEQLYIENNGMIAVANAVEGVTVWGSMQCPYYIHKGLVPIFGLNEKKVRIIQSETGGGFGGKEEFPTVLAGHAALLAWKSGRPVKMIYSRSEDMSVTTKRHPSRSKIKTGHDKDGKLLAIDFDFVIDGGAYATLSAVVLSRGTIHAAGPYSCENVRVSSRAVATNTPPHGAFRGFGAPQSIFAFERHLDHAAKKIGLTPEQIRRRNFLKRGETTATGQKIDEEINFEAILDKALKESNYHKKVKEFQEHNAKPGYIKKGMGLATFMHGAGFTGSGEAYLASVVGVEAKANGVVSVLAASTEIGQGTNTIFSQIVADALEIDYENVSVATPDTGNVPNSGPTVASRTTMIVGGLVESAALGIRSTLINAGLLKPPYTNSDFKHACKSYVEKFGALKSIAEYKQPPGVHWDDKLYRGEAYATYAWAAYVAEVSVNLLTYETHVHDFVAVQEVGKVIHPVLAAGQIEGGVAQGVGYAIYEKVNYKNGQMINNQMTNYIMPTAADVPNIRVYFEETNQKHGPHGAKGIGELPMDGPAPAILNAVEFATGVSVNAIPMLPEDFMKAFLKESTHA